MRALRFVRGDLSLDDIPIPSNKNEALIRVTLSGICNTDLEIIKGYAGFEGTIGHEFVGVVEKAADAPQLVGRRVVGEINAGCGECDRCLAGDARHCPTRTVLGIVGRDGAHAQFLQLPAGNLIEVPEKVTDEQAVFAEPLAAAIGITERVPIGREARVVVIGDGKLGLLCAMSLAARTKSVTVIGKHRSKLAIAEKAGVIGVLLEDLDDSMKGQSDVVIEASGSESGFSTAVELVKPRGQIVLKSTFQGTPVWPASSIVINEISVVGSRCGRMAPAIDMLEIGSIDVDPLIDSEYPLSEAIQAINRASSNGVLKVLVKPD